MLFVFYVCFFFFKQKTAYEMRISDWSSDVCSSDLKMVVDATTDRVVGLHMIGPDAPEILQAAAIAVKAGLTKQAFDDTVALHPSMAEELEIGRASCRERVCQDV